MGLISYSHSSLVLPAKPISYENSSLHLTGVTPPLMQHFNASRLDLLNPSQELPKILQQRNACDHPNRCQQMWTRYNLQYRQPIAFAHMIFTDVESQYANMERECLSVCYGFKKLHTYIYGRDVIVWNEHKVLEMICYKPKHVALP